MGDHALLSPSGASRWTACTPSAVLEARFPDRAGDAADEGSLAHRLSDLMLKDIMKKVSPAQFKKEVEEITRSKFYNNAMLGYCEEYTAFVMERYSEAQSHTKDALIYFEEKVSLADYVPEGYGTRDVVIIANDTLELIDLKYGKGVPVSAAENKQLMLYALGTLKDFDFIYDITKIRLTIHQPRIENFSSWEIDADELKQWGLSYLIPKAKLAYEGKGDYVPGEHCRFCRAKSLCKANADYQLQLAKFDFMEPALLTDNDVSEILGKAPMLKNWLESVETYALTEAVNNNKKWPDMKLVEGRSNRKYENPEEAAKVLKENGYNEDQVYKKELLGVTAITGLLGKKKFDTLISPLLIKPPGKPALVHVSDKRPAMSSLEAARIDFADEIEY
jgi:hypothetical protein